MIASGTASRTASRSLPGSGGVATFPPRHDNTLETHIMKKALLLALFLALAGTVYQSQTAQQSTKAVAAAPAARGSLVHMVAFKFKPEAGAEKIKGVETAFAALKTKIPQIMSFEWGTNVSPEKLDKGFTHGFILTFKNEKDRDAYLVHPDHQAFGKLVGEVLADVFVVDFQSRP